MPDIATLATVSSDTGLTDHGTVLASTSQLAFDASKAAEIYVFPLAEPELDLHVVRLLVPGMESVVDEGVMRVGGHMLARLLGGNTGT